MHHFECKWKNFSFYHVAASNFISAYSIQSYWIPWYLSNLFISTCYTLSVLILYLACLCGCGPEPGAGAPISGFMSCLGGIDCGTFPKGGDVALTWTELVPAFLLAIPAQEKVFCSIETINKWLNETTKSHTLFDLV